jgi:hypothetical protein
VGIPTHSHFRVIGLAAYLTFGLIGPSIPLLVLALILAEVTIGIVQTAEHGTVAGAASEDIRGSAFGFLAAIQSFSNLSPPGSRSPLDPGQSAGRLPFASAGMIIATDAGLSARRHSGETDKSTAPTDPDHSG